MPPASSDQEPKVVTLRFGGHDLRITYGSEVRAEEQDPRKKWVRIWPRGRMLDPTPDTACRSTPDWKLPAGLSWADIFTQVPADLLSVAARFSMQQWPALEFAHNDPAFRDLLRSNPVLAYALACNDEFRSTPKEEAAKRAASKSALKQRDIAKYLGFPGTEPTVRLFKQLIPEVANPSALRLLRGALPFDPALAKLISHMDSINAGVLAFLSQEPLRELITPRLLGELTACGDEWSRAPTADLVLDSLRMIAGIKGATLPPIHSPARCKDIHDRILLEYLAEHERQRREQEANVARERVRLEEQARVEAELQAARCGGEPFPNPPIPGTSTIVPIVSAAELILEGLLQKNCVASYAHGIRAGGLYFYKVMAPERASLLIRRNRGGSWSLEQIKKKANRSVSADTTRAVQMWLGAHDPKRRREWNETPF